MCHPLESLDSTWLVLGQSGDHCTPLAYSVDPSIRMAARFKKGSSDMVSGPTSTPLRQFSHPPRFGHSAPLPHFSGAVLICLSTTGIPDVRVGTIPGLALRRGADGAWIGKQG